MKSKEIIKRAIGRPTKYSPQIIEEINKYLEYAIPGNMEIPTVEGIALRLGISKDTLYEWAKVHPEFSDIMEELSSKQADRLMNNGLAGTYNPTIAKVLLTKHGYREGIDQTTNDKDLPTPILNGLPNNDSNTESQTAP